MLNSKYQESYGGKFGRCVGLTTLAPSCTDCLEILGASISRNPKGQSRLVMGHIYISNQRKESYNSSSKTRVACVRDGSVNLRIHVVKDTGDLEMAPVTDLKMLK